MESSNSFNLDAAISQYISQVNSAKILSEEEKDQICDHLHSETTSLQNSSLNAKEAFFVAKMRFGDSGVIQQEFAKAKPWNSLFKGLSVAVMLFLGVKLILNVANVLSFLVLVVLREFSAASIKFYLTIGDWIFQAGIIMFLSYLGYITLAKARKVHIKHLWSLPVLFLLSHIAYIATHNALFNDRDFMSRSAPYEDSYGMIFFHNSHYINGIVIVLVIITSLWVLYRNKDQQIQFA